MASGKKYGLIIPSKKVVSVTKKATKPSIFGESSDEEVSLKIILNSPAWFNVWCLKSHTRNQESVGRCGERIIREPNRLRYVILMYGVGG